MMAESVVQDLGQRMVALEAVVAGTNVDGQRLAQKVDEVNAKVAAVEGLALRIAQEGCWMVGCHQRNTFVFMQALA